MQQFRRGFLRGEEGIAASEYALLLGLTVLLLFIVVRVYGRQLSAQWTNVAVQVFAGPPGGGSGGNGNNSNNSNNGSPGNSSGGSGPPGNPSPGNGNCGGPRCP